MRVLDAGVHAKTTGRSKLVGSVSDQKATPPFGSKPRCQTNAHAPFANAANIYGDLATDKSLEQISTSFWIKILESLIGWKIGYLGDKLTSFECMRNQNGDPGAVVDKIKHGRYAGAKMFGQVRTKKMNIDEML
jgi:hypothetical protein